MIRKAIIHLLLFILLIFTPPAAATAQQLPVILRTVELLAQPDADTEAGPVAVVMEFKSGPEASDTFIHREQQWGESLYDKEFRPGERFIGLTDYRAGERQRISVGEKHRETGIFLLFIAVTLVLFVIGRWEGLVGLFSAFFSGFLIFFLLFPGLLGDLWILPLAFFICLFTVFFTILPVTRFSRAAVPAIISLTISLAIVFFFATGGYGFLRLDGSQVRHARLILTWLDHYPVFSAGNLWKLIVSGIVISTLGAMMDVTIVISSTIDEIVRDRPESKFTDAFQSGYRVGQQILSTMVNTLFFAYAGVMLPAFLAFSVFNLSWLRFLNYDFIGVEILRISIGLIGLALVIPICSAVTAWWCTNFD